jgi:carboxymethylenebutenolidase
MEEIEQRRVDSSGEPRLTRRRFVQAVAGMGAAGALSPVLDASASAQTAAPAAGTAPAESQGAEENQEAEEDQRAGIPQWNQFNTGAYDGILTETITYPGHNGDFIHAYFARPAGPGPFPGITLVHHAPGYDEFYREMAYRFANHGCVVMMPDLFCRYGHGTPDEAAAKAREAGGVPDDQVVGDLTEASRFLRAQPTSNGKVGIIGTCSGGRHAFLAAASQPEDFDAVADLWGGRVVMRPEDLNANMPVAPLDYTPDLRAPVLGLFGNDDRNPSPQDVDTLEAALQVHGKRYEFHRYDGAGHGFFYYHTGNYRQQQAMDGWSKVFEFFDRELAAE